MMMMSGCDYCLALPWLLVLCNQIEHAGTVIRQ